MKKEPADGYFDNVWLKGAFVASYWGGRPAATQMLERRLPERGALERDALEQRRASTRLLADAQAETDETRRQTLIWDMQAMLTERRRHR